MPKAKKIKVAVIGAGNMGSNHVRNYTAIPDAELVAIADNDRNVKKISKDFKVPFFEDYKKMIKEAKPDAVSIAAPTNLHKEIGLYCMENGIHCLVEKPIAITIKEADELIGTAEKLGVIFTVGHIERYNPVIRKIKEIIDNKELGKILSVVCTRVGGFPDLEPKTDVIIDLAVHDIDIINNLLGRLPGKISTHGSRTHHTKEIDSAKILLDYGNAGGFIQANWVTPVKIRTIALTGSHGYIEGNYITQELTHYKHNMRAVREGFTSFVSSLGEAAKEIISVDFQEPLAIELKKFIAAVKSGDDSELVKPWDAREALRLALEAVKDYKIERAT